jgi:hypothetical protein
MSNVELNSERLFHWIDYVVFAFSLVVSAAIGIYHGFRGKKQSSVGEFLMGDRKMSLLPVALSMQATFLSAIFLLGVPAEIYTFGTMYLSNCIGHAIAIPIIAHLFVPIFRRRRLMISAHEVGYCYYYCYYYYCYYYYCYYYYCYYYYCYYYYCYYYYCYYYYCYYYCYYYSIDVLILIVHMTLTLGVHSTPRVKVKEEAKRWARNHD